MGGLQIFYPVNPPRGVYSGGFTADNIDGPYGITCLRSFNFNLNVFIIWGDQPNSTANSAKIGWIGFADCLVTRKGLIVFNEKKNYRVSTFY